jgi:ribulose-5-phosphate 4-epimerase/fuculose-1-phosphate aldolase
MSEIPNRFESKEQLIAYFKAIGRACLTVDLQNSHSGNIACRWIDERGADVLAITSAGSQKGALKTEEICFPGIGETTFGHYKASSETDIHAAINAMPGVGGSIHGHTKSAVIETLDDEEKPNEPKALCPIDPLGFYALGATVPVHYYPVPVGSPEMVETVPRDLKDTLVSIIQGHGAFTRGNSVEHAFYNLCLTEASGYILQMLRRLGVDSRAVYAQVRADPESAFSYRPRDYAPDRSGRCDFCDEPHTVQDFLIAGERIFESRLSPFHTGSMSLRGTQTMMYVAGASMPAGLPCPMLELDIDLSGSEGPEERIHKEIYNRTSYQSVMHTYTPEAEAQAWFTYPGESSPTDRVVPIDGEGSFFYLVIPILPPKVTIEELVAKLHEYRVVIVRGGGVWAVGEQSISEVLHHPSSIRDVCLYRLGAVERGLDLKKLEPKKAAHW